MRFRNAGTVIALLFLVIAVARFANTLHREHEADERREQRHEQRRER